MAKHIFSILLVLLSAQSAFSQTAIIKGLVIDETTSAPLEFATISFKSNIDSVKLQGTKADINGKFSANSIRYGKYTVTISSLGYESKILKNYTVNSPEIDMGSLTLKASSKMLKDIKISGEKAQMELGIDKKTFNVDKNITSAGGTAADVMRNIPSVNVDGDGNISVRGKENVTLLIDGKPSAIFGDDAATALATIPASSIESIEVITNPSSKYEAQGMNGIVNIILKKDRKPGYNGMLTLGAGYPLRLNTGLNLNANVKKWNFFINGNIRGQKAWERTVNRRDNYDNDFTFATNSYNKRRPLSGFVNAGAEYQLDKNNKITFSQSFFNAGNWGDVETEIVNGINFSTPITTTIRKNKYTGNPMANTSNLQYKHTFKDPKEDINFEVNFSKRRYIRQSEFTTRVFDDKDSLINSFDQSNPVRGGNWNGTFVVDYTKPLGKNGKLELGERSYLIQFKSENQPTINVWNQGEVPETILKNHFNFMQQVHGAYMNVGNQFKKTGVQLGLRAELFAYQGTIHQYNASASDQYLSLFPTAFVSHKLDKQNDLNISYSRRVNRPNFYQLIPFIDASNPQDTSMGNPNLRPEFINAVELSHSLQYGKSNNLISSFYYQYTNNLIQRYRRFNDDGTTFTQNQNLAVGETYGMELINKMNFTDWWDATVNVNIFRNKISGNNVDPSLNRSGWGGFMKLNSNTKINKDLSAQVTANYFAATVIAQGEIRPYSNVDIAIKKSFYKNLMNLTFTVSDVFNTLQTETIYNLYPYYNQSVLRKNLTRMYGLNLQIRFANKSALQSADAPKKPTMMAPPKKEKSKEQKNRDENLKKDEGGGDEGGGGNRQ